MLNIKKIRSDFPAIINNNIVYFDNAATTQKPKYVMDVMNNFYCKINANVHRSTHELSYSVTTAFENTRAQVQKFINAESREEIIFTPGATYAINMVAQSLAQNYLQDGDEILISTAEHHANIVPWQMICKLKNLKLKVATILSNGEFDLNAFKKLLTKKTKLVAINHVSNVTGIINPVAIIIKLAHENNSLVLIDGAQAIAHLEIDVAKLNCDFYVFSAHKMYGPTGVGILYGKKHLLNEMPPVVGGGNMIKEVSFENTTFAELPFKFEAGTPDIAAVISFNAAINYLKQFDKDELFNYENDLLNYAIFNLKKISNIKILGESKNKISIISFVVDGINSNDLAILLDEQKVALRNGHHCAIPLHKFFNVTASIRLSLTFYNTIDEIDFFIIALNKALKILKG